MNWETLTKQQQLSAIIAGLFVGLLIIYLIIIQPIYNTNSQLNKQQQQQNQLKEQLNFAKSKLHSASYHPSLNPTKAKKILLDVLSNKNISQRSNLKIRNKSIKKMHITIKEQTFFSLIQALETLKTQYGIVIDTANITKISSGIVKADLTIIYP